MKNPLIFPATTNLWHLLLSKHTLSALTRHLFISGGYPPDMSTCSTGHTHTVYGHASAKGLVCSSCTPESCPVALLQLNTSIPKHTHTHTFCGKGNLKDVDVCVCPIPAVSPVQSPSSFNSLAFNGLCSALQPNHRPVSFGLTEYNKDSGGK